MDRKDLQVLSRIRIREAKALLNVGLHDGAYYLAGYAVECALKACIAKGTQRHEFPDKKKVEASHTHNLRDPWSDRQILKIRASTGREAIRYFGATGILWSHGRSKTATAGSDRKMLKHSWRRLTTEDTGSSHG